MISISFLTAPAHRTIERQTTIRLVAGNSSVIRAQSYQIPIEILLNFHHFIEIFNTQSLLHKMSLNVDYDRRKYNNDLELLNAIAEKNTAAASVLISSRSVNLNGKLWPLHHAAQRGRVEIMTMLLDAGADINAVDKNRNTACHVANLYDQFDALKLLVERGASLGIVDFSGRSLLANVSQNDRSEPFSILLLDAGAPLDGLSNRELMKLVKSVAVFDRLLARDVNLTAMRDEATSRLRMTSVFC
jgi:ankyrin repeat protein